MAKRRSKPRGSYKDSSSKDIGRHAMSSVWEGERILDGFASIGRVEAELSRAQDDPKDRPRQFEKARELWRRQWFIRQVILLRYYFFTYGFRLSTQDKKGQAAVNTWEQNNRKLYRRYARDCW